MEPVRALVIGMGEVGQALKLILSEKYEVHCRDVEEVEIPQGISVMHVALNYVALGHDKWLEITQGYIEKYRPRLIDICSTVRPGTTRLLGPNASHSTTRGLHPHLAEGLRSIPKHIGGQRAGELASYYSNAGIKCIVHKKPETTEVAHIAHLLDYGIQLISADMRQKLCRETNVDYLEAVTKYTETHNSGFLSLDMPSKVRMNLTPPNGRVGGHCVIQAAQLARLAGFAHPLVDMLARYNDR